MELKNLPTSKNWDYLYDLLEVIITEWFYISQLQLKQINDQKKNEWQVKTLKRMAWWVPMCLSSNFKDKK